MTQRELRNALISALHAYLGRPVALSDQTMPESEYPYVYYQPVRPYMPRGGANIRRETVPGTDGFVHDIVNRREEYADGTFSFTACSRNRETSDGYILGDNEALELAECAQGIFIHTGKHILQDAGIAVVEVMDVQSRSFLEVDEVDRRYGFDVRVRYLRVDERVDGTIEEVSVRES